MPGSLTYDQTLIVNYHSGLCLEAVESGVVQTTCSSNNADNDLERWTVTNTDSLTANAATRHSRPLG
jgi:hypothetical protein